jgi:hypothetical protein
MSEQVDALFEALFALTDLRVLLRETAPLHKLDEEQQAQARSAVVRAKEALSRLEGALENEDRK